jgi:hypothetical protein
VPGTIRREDYRQDIQQRLQAYAEAAIQRVMARQGFVAPSARGAPADADEMVDGYRRSDGVWVKPYVRRRG